MEVENSKVEVQIPDVLSLRSRIVDNLVKLGFGITNDGQLFLPQDKQLVRNAHSIAVKLNISKHRKIIEKHDEEFLNKYIIDGKDLDVANIDPWLETVNDENSNLFNWIKLHWSIPISAGYGRRLRYLVKDRTNDAIIGIIGLADPVYGLKDRDSLIGWSADMRRKRLKNVMDAFVLGAVPPYSNVLGGKLIASLLASPRIRNDFRKKYKGTRALISGSVFDGKLAAITTASAYGKSSVYDRIKIKDGPEFRHSGWTSGSGEFHLFSDAYPELVELVKDDVNKRKNPLWGTGIRNRRVVILEALEKLSLPKTLMYHNLKRELFIMPLGRSSFEFLRGESDIIDYYNLKQEDISDFIIRRWMIPRSVRDQSYLEFRKEFYSLMPKILELS